MRNLIIYDLRIFTILLLQSDIKLLEGNGEQ